MIATVTVAVGRVDSATVKLTLSPSRSWSTSPGGDLTRLGLCAAAIPGNSQITTARDRAPMQEAARSRSVLWPAACCAHGTGSNGTQRGVLRDGAEVVAPGRKWLLAAGASEGALRSALCALRSALCALRSALCALRSALCALRSALCALRSALCALRSALCALRSALCALRSALCALRSALCARERTASSPRCQVFSREAARIGLRTGRIGERGQLQATGLLDTTSACTCILPPPGGGTDTRRIIVDFENNSKRQSVRRLTVVLPGRTWNGHRLGPDSRCLPSAGRARPATAASRRYDPAMIERVPA